MSKKTCCAQCGTDTSNKCGICHKCLGGTHLEGLYPSETVLSDFPRAVDPRREWISEEEWFEELVDCLIDD